MIEVPPHLKETIARDGLWVFAYGSLMWRPNFSVAASRRGQLFGYHRALCIYSVAYRGTYEKPGLVFGLDVGGSCQGMVLNAAPSDVDSVMGYLYEREMIHRVYVPKWLTIHTPDGPVTAWVFVADRTHDQYTGRLSLDEEVRLIHQGHGKGGACIDYLESTLQHLRETGIHDHALERVVRAARAEGSSRTPD